MIENTFGANFFAKANLDDDQQSQVRQEIIKVCFLHLRDTHKDEFENVDFSVLYNVSNCIKEAYIKEFFEQPVFAFMFLKYIEKEDISDVQKFYVNGFE